MTAWIPLLPEIRTHRVAADDAVKVLTSVTVELAAGPTEPTQRADVLSRTVQAWSAVVNHADRLAGLGIALYSDHPDPARTLVAGTVLELLDNIIDTASSITLLAPDQTDAFVAAVAGQPRALEFAQELVDKAFPDTSAQFKLKFQALGLPVAGFTPRATPVAAATPAMTFSGSRLRILHISDLHRTKDEVIGNHELLSDLMAGLKTLSDKDIDCIVVSGDLTQEATKREYDQCAEFLTALVDKLLGGKKDRCVVVPGNHDVEWDVCAGRPFRATSGKIPVDGRQRPGALQLEHGFIAPEHDTLIASKSNFRDFHASFFGETIPEDPTKAYIIRTPKDLPIAFLLLDTAFGIHHLSDAAMVNREALIAGVDAVSATGAGIVVAVGHHGPIVQAGDRDAIEPWVLERMADGVVSTYLHGHVHKTRAYHYTADGVRLLPCVGVGSVVAGPKQRPESTPRHYNILDIPLVGKTGRVTVRRKDGRDARWQVDKRFGSALDPSDSFAIRW